MENKESKSDVRKPADERLQALRSLPADIVKTFTKEEMNAFLFEDDWPDSLQEKLKDYMVEE
ncbi:MAG: hypothetical protein HXY52_02070 [Nitrospirae bacterium]|jgi:hypothetical protein|nr:hypothetical protein [Nitrospirota bacterium]